MKRVRTTRILYSALQALEQQQREHVWDGCAKVRREMAVRGTLDKEQKRWEPARA